MAGYARTSIEAQAWTDTRFDRLARSVGLPDRESALIRCARLWAWQTDNFHPDRPTYVVDAETIEIAMGLVGVAQVLVKVELADEAPDGYRIRGSKGRIEWLWNSRTARKRSGPHETLSADTSADRSADASPDRSGDRLDVSRTFLDPSSGSSDLSSSQKQIRKEGSEEHDQARASKAAAKQAKAAKVPDLAWRAADRLRELVLEENPSAALRKQPWGDEGLRLRWADTMRLLVERDGRTYEQIADVLDWLFHHQPPGAHRYIVQSPDSLREKWDRIEANRRNRAHAPARETTAFDRQLERIRQLEAEEAAGEPQQGNLL